VTPRASSPIVLVFPLFSPATPKRSITSTSTISDEANEPEGIVVEPHGLVNQSTRAIPGGSSYVAG
jgi:hypothetical protein